MSISLKERTVKSLALPIKGNKIYYDEHLKGFGARVTSSGTLAFVLNYSINGRERRFTIGTNPPWTVAAARKRAEELKIDISRGIDPLEKRQTDRNAPTIKSVWEFYRKRKLAELAKRSQLDVISMWGKYVLPLIGNVKLDDLQASHIDELHRSISAHAPIRANRVLENVRRALNVVKREGWISDNPADGFTRNREEAKDNYLTPKELNIVLECLERMPNEKAANAIRMLILTGARRGEVLSATWDQFDLEKAIWIKPASQTKQRKLHRVPISIEVIKLLKQMQESSISKYLFPNVKGTGPIPDIKRPWAWLKEETKQHELRIHDLRHTFASLLISEGENLAVIGKLLGHSQHQTTMRYAHLMDDPLRLATGRISNVISREKQNDNPSEKRIQN